MKAAMLLLREGILRICYISPFNLCFVDGTVGVLFYLFNVFSPICFSLFLSLFFYSIHQLVLEMFYHLPLTDHSFFLQSTFWIITSNRTVSMSIFYINVIFTAKKFNRNNSDNHNSAFQFAIYSVCRHSWSGFHFSHNRLGCSHHDGN